MTKFELPKLDFDYGALEPYIDAKTMEIHHTKHHQAYIDKLNAGMDGGKWFEDKSLEEIIVNWEDAPEGKKDIVRNHGGGHHNHSFFWAILTPGGNDQVSGDLLDKINTDFGSVDECKLKVTEAATTHFGSGWGWLVLNKDSKLEALSTP
ncbi:MAG TPA: superoxide dismutase, partial [Vicingus sp.]|nr:superoxide dismutase [Vicingus sp.]